VFLTASPLLIAAAAVASPEFVWLDDSTATLATPPRVFVAPTGDGLWDLVDVDLFIEAWLRES